MGFWGKAPEFVSGKWGLDHRLNYYNNALLASDPDDAPLSS